MPPKTEEGSLFFEEIQCGYYAATLLDILGSKDKLQTWENLPPDSESQPQLKQSVVQSLRPLLLLEQDFRKYFRAFQEATTRRCDIHSILTQHPDSYKRFLHHEIGTQQFADTFLFYAPCRNAFGDLSVVQLHGMLLACSMAMILSLARGFALRGAVTVGTGAELGHHIFYGPALADLHAIEQKDHNYPRIILSGKAIAYARARGPFSDDQKVDAFMRSVASLCRNMMCRDIDNNYIVDFLGKEVRDLDPQGISEMRQAISMAHSHVRSEIVRFSNSENHDLENRYQLLSKYFDARLPLWFNT